MHAIGERWRSHSRPIVVRIPGPDNLALFELLLRLLNPIEPERRVRLPDCRPASVLHDSVAVNGASAGW